MLRKTLQSTIEAAVAALVREGRLPAAVAEVPVEITDTRSPEHGDYACNFAMAAAKKAGMNPRTLGEALKEALLSGDGSPWSRDAEPETTPLNARAKGGTVGEGVPVGTKRGTVGEGVPNLLAAVEVAGPGFLNLRLHPEAVAAYVPKILAAENLAHVENPNPQRINVEFVSVNPNGPITIGSGRGAAFGSSLCNVLEAAGNVVHREYYINDGVNSEQMRQFGYAVAAFYDNLLLGTPLPENLPYRGEYVQETAFSAAMISAPRIALQWILRTKSEAEHTVDEFFDLVRNWIRLKPVFDQDADSSLELKDLVQGSADILDGVWPLSHHPQLENEDIQSAALIYAFFVMRREGQPITSRGSLQDTASQAFRFIWPSVIEDQKLLLAGQEPEFNPFNKFFNRSALEIAAEIQGFLPNVQVEEEAGPREQVLAEVFRNYSQEKMIERQRDDLSAFGVEFDTWFSEQSLHDEGIVASRIQYLEDTKVADEEPYRTKLKLGKGGVVEETIREEQVIDEDDVAGEGTTLWLRSTKFGDDMDRVLRRGDGRLTYIASDVSYHENKLTRPEDATKMITILGPDHHGYIGRLTAVVAALLRGPDDTPEANAKALAEAKEKLEVVIYQLVRFLKDGKPAPMRKRDGNIYELRDLIDELGKNLVPDGTKEERRTTGRDVARFFYLMRSHDTTMDFDIDLATQQSDENPVFYAQYAHARIASVLRKAQNAPLSLPRVEPLNPDNLSTGDERGVGGRAIAAYRLLTHPRETALIKKILDLPWEVERVAKDYGVHRLATYAVELARTYHHFYDACRVLQPDQPELTEARLALCQATQKALKSTFDLLGVSAPERLERRTPEEPTP